MHDLKEIRKDFAAFKEALGKRSVDIDFIKLKDLDIKNRDFIQKKETLEKEKKIYQNQKINLYLLNQKKFPNLLIRLLMNKKRLN